MSTLGIHDITGLPEEIRRVWSEQGLGSKATIANMEALATAIAAKADKAYVDGQLSEKAPLVHTHAWTDITGKPTTFAPSAHSHAIADVTGLQTALDGKAPIQQATRAQTDSAGLYTWTYPTAYGAGVVPIIKAIAEGPNPAGGVLINAQLEGAPTNTQCRIRVTKSQQSVVALLGLTILSVPASVGATWVHIEARAP